MKKLPQIKAMQRSDAKSLSLLQASSDLAFQYHKSTKGSNFGNEIRHGNTEAAVAALLGTMDDFSSGDELDENGGESPALDVSIVPSRRVRKLK